MPLIGEVSKIGQLLTPECNIHVTYLLAFARQNFLNLFGIFPSTVFPLLLFPSIKTKKSKNLFYHVTMDTAQQPEKPVWGVETAYFP